MKNYFVAFAYEKNEVLKIGNSIVEIDGVMDTGDLDDMCDIIEEKHNVKNIKILNYIEL